MQTNLSVVRLIVRNLDIFDKHSKSNYDCDINGTGWHIYRTCPGYLYEYADSCDYRLGLELIDNARRYNGIIRV